MLPSFAASLPLGCQAVRRVITVSLNRNIVANFASQAYVSAISLFMVPVYVGYMGAEGYGLLGFFVTLQAWFMVLDFGLSQTFVRDVARYRGGTLDSSRFRGLVRAMEIAFFGLASAGVAGLIWSAPSIATDWLHPQHLAADEVTDAIRLMAGIVGLQLAITPHRSLVVGFERQVWLGGLTIGLATARFALIVPLFWRFGATPHLFFGYQLAISVAESAILVWQAHRILWRIGGTRFARPTQPSFQAFRGNGAFALTMAFTSSVWLVVTYSDRLILSRLLSLSDFAYFSIAIAAASLIGLISAPVSMALLPRLAKLAAENNHAKLILVYRQFTQLVCILAFPAAASLAFFSRLALFVWTGNSDLAEHAWSVLALYAVGNALFAVAAFPYYLQYANGNLRFHLYGNALFLLFFVPSLVWLTIHYGALGAAFAWLTINLLYLLLWVPVVHRRVAPGLHAKWVVRDVLSISIPVFLCCGFLFVILPQQTDTRASGLLLLCLVGALATLSGFLCSTAGLERALSASFPNRKVIASWLSTAIRHLSVRQLLLRRRQAAFLLRNLENRRRAIVFLVPGVDDVNGGIMAIVSHVAESARMSDIHQAQVHLCTLPHGFTLMRYSKFVNSATLVSFDLLLTALESDALVHVNVPEVYVEEFLKWSLPILSAQPGHRFSFNIMLQNIDFVPSRESVDSLRKAGPVTVTTAHKAYAGRQTSEQLGCPVWHWSVWVSPEKYTRLEYERKEKLIVYSPDEHPLSGQVLRALRAELPDYRFVRIWDFTYEQYKQLISRARFSITFGEGLDGYFVEPILSGSIGCAVFNQRFFTQSYRGLPFVFDDWAHLERELPRMIRDIDGPTFVSAQAIQYRMIAREYSYAEYQQNLRRYYAEALVHWPALHP
jgi:O-antigen/teichoic acid export membrane protein